MSNTVIHTENISKLYRLGEVGTGTLSHDLNRWWHRVRGKEDPYLKLGQENKRDSKGGEYVWAIRDVDFDVKEGEVLGIIGRNGAGKSTLLKILSRVTQPTTGIIRAKGRVASLLEVGTGFHPELTGRDNIYLNGAILGMTKQEIRKKFDEIVSFSGVERYIDTPVKRYSSGMYVRLAFAVAAHLEPEILIVDEVLAVGDADFQKKCMGKMKDVSENDGRTVLFVSHNMAAISTLCTRVLLMQDGKVGFDGSTSEGIEKYIKGAKISSGFVDLATYYHASCTFSRLKSIGMYDANDQEVHTCMIGAPVKVQIGFELFEDVRNLEIGFCINNPSGITLFGYVSPWENFQQQFSKGEHLVECEIPFLHLLPNSYTITVWIKRVGETIDDEVEHALEFEVLSQDLNGSNAYFDRYNVLNGYQPSNWRKR